MFRLECFVDDKQLARVMHGLAGAVHDLKVLPVINAKVEPKAKAKTNGVAAEKPHGTLEELFMAWLREKNIKRVTRAVADDFAKSVGRSAATGPGLLNRLVVKGRLRKAKGGIGSGYEVRA